MRWANGVSHRREDAQAFLNEHFSNETRIALLVGGAGFDPRSGIFPQLLHHLLDDRLHVLLYKEERPDALAELRSRAQANQDLLTADLVNLTIEPIDILSADLAVVGGRMAVKRLVAELENEYTDIVLDLSALSLGVGFPLIRCALEWAEKSGGEKNVHVVLAAHPDVDRHVLPQPLDRSKEVYGFKGKFGIEETSEAARLWLPQLAFEQGPALEMIYEEVLPHDVCPILPFPSRNPRTGDKLLAHFSDKVLDVWGVTPKNVIFAAEGNPFDLYRTILRIDDERSAVFKETGGSQLILSPTGSKAMALGAVMAAIERDLPMRYVESIGYKVEWKAIEQHSTKTVELLHLWLAGEPYRMVKTGDTA